MLQSKIISYKFLLEFKLARMLKKNPQKKGIVRAVRIITPRKPNSARRSGVKLQLSTKKHTIAYIPGSGHTLKKYSTTLVQGRGSRDLPGVYCRCIRGVKDLKNLPSKGRRRSLYGVKKRDYLAFRDLKKNNLL